MKFYKTFTTITVTFYEEFSAVSDDVAKEVALNLAIQSLSDSVYQNEISPEVVESEVTLESVEEEE